MKERKPLKLPSADANEHELVAHFSMVGTIFASVSHEVALDLCNTCCRDGENVTGKKNNPGDRNRFCSDECEALFVRRWALYTARRAELPEGEAKMVGDSPSVARRKAAPKTKRVGRPGGPKCGKCHAHPRSAKHKACREEA